MKRFKSGPTTTQLTHPSMEKQKRPKTANFTDACFFSIFMGFADEFQHGFLFFKLLKVHVCLQTTETPCMYMYGLGVGLEN